MCANFFDVRTFGNALGEPGAPSRSLHGVAVDGVLALSPGRLRRLQPSEAPAPGKILAESRCPVSGKAAGADQEPGDNDSDLYVESGTTVYPLCSGGHISGLETQLVAGEGGAMVTLGEVPLASAWTTGPKTLLYIIARFSDETSWPASIATGQNTCAENAAYFATSSYGAPRSLAVRTNSSGRSVVRRRISAIQLSRLASLTASTMP